MKQHMVLIQTRKEGEMNKSAIFDINKPIVKWTVGDIQLWFSHHNIRDTLVRLFDFQSTDEIEEYAVKLCINSKEFTRYEK